MAAVWMFPNCKFVSSTLVNCLIPCTAMKTAASAGNKWSERTPTVVASCNWVTNMAEHIVYPSFYTCCTEIWQYDAFINTSQEPNILLCNTWTPPHVICYVIFHLNNSRFHSEYWPTFSLCSWEYRPFFTNSGSPLPCLPIVGSS